MHQRQRLAAMERFGRAQQRERHRMVSAQKHTMVPRHQRSGLRLDVAAHLGQWRSVGQAHVERVAQVGQRRDVEHRVDAVAQHQAGRADRLRAETRAGPVGHHAIEWHTGHRERLVGQRRAAQKTVAVVGVSELTHGHGRSSVGWGEVEPEDTPEGRGA
ncbi:hypothetical protein D9M68_847490 [compost metagenome]